MLPAALETKEISPKIRFDPLLMRMATPREPSTTSGSSQEVVVSSRIRSTKDTPATEIIRIWDTVLVVATAVETAEPLMALSGPMSSRMASTAEMRLLLSMVTENSAALS